MLQRQPIMTQPTLTTPIGIFQAQGYKRHMRVQFLKTDGEELAVLPRREYELLLARAAAAPEKRPAPRPHGVADLPIDLEERIRAGEHPVRVLMNYRGMTQDQLAAKSGKSQSLVSKIISGRRGGRARSLQAIADALDVSVELLESDPWVDCAVGK